MIEVGVRASGTCHTLGALLTRDSSGGVTPALPSFYSKVFSELN